MPAATLRQLESSLSQYLGYARNGVDMQGFSATLSEVLERIYGAGRWRDTTFELSITPNSTNGHFVLPPQAESLMFAVVDRVAVFNRPLWHDYINQGAPNTSTRHYGVIDSGWGVGVSELTEGGGYAATFTKQDGTTFDGSATFTVTGYTNDVWFSEDVTPSGVSTISTTNTDIDVLEGISWSGLDGRVDVSLVNTDTDLNVDEFGWIIDPEGTLRTRRYRIGEWRSDSTVWALCKRRVPHLNDPNTIIHVGNVSALKHGMLAKNAEDNADPTQATYHWEQCFQILDEELAESFGGQQFIAPISLGIRPIETLL